MNYFLRSFSFVSYQLSAISLLPYNVFMQDFTQLKDERECVLVVFDDDLRVCAVQKAHNFTVNLYKKTADFPLEEKANAMRSSRL